MSSARDRFEAERELCLAALLAALRMPARVGIDMLERAGFVVDARDCPPHVVRVSADREPGMPVALPDRDGAAWALGIMRKLLGTP